MSLVSLQATKKTLLFMFRELSEVTLSYTTEDLKRLRDVFDAVRDNIVQALFELRERLLAEEPITTPPGERIDFPFDVRFPRLTPDSVSANATNYHGYAPGAISARPHLTWADDHYTANSTTRPSRSVADSVLTRNSGYSSRSSIRTRSSTGMRRLSPVLEFSVPRGTGHASKSSTGPNAVVSAQSDSDYLSNSIQGPKARTPREGEGTRDSSIPGGGPSARVNNRLITAFVNMVFTVLEPTSPRQTFVDGIECTKHLDVFTKIPELDVSSFEDVKTVQLLRREQRYVDITSLLSRFSLLGSGPEAIRSLDLHDAMVSLRISKERTGLLPLW